MTIARALAHTIFAYAKSGVAPATAINRVLLFASHRGLEGFKTSILRELSRILDEKQDQHAIRLFTPFPLTDKEKEALKAQHGIPSGNSMEEIIDKNSIGGYRLEHDHRYVDTTVKKSVDRLTKAFART